MCEQCGHVSKSEAVSEPDDRGREGTLSNADSRTGRQGGEDMGAGAVNGLVRSMDRVGDALSDEERSLVLFMRRFVFGNRKAMDAIMLVVVVCCCETNTVVTCAGDLRA